MDDKHSYANRKNTWKTFIVSRLSNSYKSLLQNMQVVIKIIETP